MMVLLPNTCKKKVKMVLLPNNHINLDKTISSMKRTRSLVQQLVDFWWNYQAFENQKLIY